ncbi:hypothetical protein [Geodermatophilus obscurus]|uniref:hypothetical protein n=1 Tax=Geodermatophilus obscurus TaxID=1861 RepID=UPI0031ECE900
MEQDVLLEEQAQPHDRDQERDVTDAAIAHHLAPVTEPGEVQPRTVSCSIQQVEVRIVEGSLTQAEQPQGTHGAGLVGEGHRDVRLAGRRAVRWPELPGHFVPDVSWRTAQPHAEDTVDVMVDDGDLGGATSTVWHPIPRVTGGCAPPDERRRGHGRRRRLHADARTTRSCGAAAEKWSRRRIDPVGRR